MTRNQISYPLPAKHWKEKLLAWARTQDPVCFLDSSNHPGQRAEKAVNSYLAVGQLDAVVMQESGAFDALRKLADRAQDWLFGYLSYDLKNELEDLQSNNFDGLNLPLLHFFQPRWLFLISAVEITIAYHPEKDSPETIEQLWQGIQQTKPNTTPTEAPNLEVYSRISREEYLQQVQQLKKHIHYGDIYEVNFCQEFFSESAIDPYALYPRLNRISPTPFSCFYHHAAHYLLCGSPERYIRKTGNQLVSQPIKGTAPRGVTAEEDEANREALYHSTKDRSENVMIVDLVRNDLSRVADKGSVTVDELFGIYSFPKVHQMISTVSCSLRKDLHPVDALKATFPMGSMTGAPKIRAMQLIEEYESTKRGLYSGAVGYLTPAGDFDFNVVIRSMIYDAEKPYLSFMVGGAIIDASDPEREYEECLLKARAIFETLGVTAPVPLSAATI